MNTSLSTHAIDTRTGRCLRRACGVAALRKMSRLGFVPYDLSREMQGAVQEKLSELVLTLAGTVFMIGDPEETLTKLFRDEQAVVRAINFTSSLVATYNILGKSPRTTLSDWLEPKAKEYKRKRSIKWDAKDPVQKHDRAESFSPDDARRSTMLGAEDPGGLTHKDIQTVSLIREPLWLRAKWVATVFTHTPDGKPCPPGLALAFTHICLTRFQRFVGHKVLLEND